MAKIRYPDYAHMKIISQRSRKCRSKLVWVITGFVFHFSKGHVRLKVILFKIAFQFEAQMSDLL